MSIRLKKIQGSKDVDFLRQKAADNHFHRIHFQTPPAHNLGSIFSEVKYKRIPHIIIRIVRRFARICHFSKNTEIKFTKLILLCIYGEFSIYPYISNFNINCFIWKDDKSDEAFEKYIDFVNRMTLSRSLEIEII